MFMLQDSFDVFDLHETWFKAYVWLLWEQLGAGTALNGSADADRRPGEPGVLITMIEPRWGPSYESL